MEKKSVKLFLQWKENKMRISNALIAKKVLANDYLKESGNAINAIKNSQIRHITLNNKLLEKV